MGCGWGGMWPGGDGAGVGWEWGGMVPRKDGARVGWGWGKMGLRQDGVTVKGTAPAAGCRRKRVLPGRRLCAAAGCISVCSSLRAGAGEGSGRMERSPPHSQRRCYFNNTPLACMPGLILTLEPRQAGPNFPRCDLSQLFPFENKAPVPASLSPQAAACCPGSCPAGQGKAGPDLPLGGLFGEQEGGQCGAPHQCSAPRRPRHGDFRKLAGSRGMLACRALPGIVERLRFPQTSLGRRWVFFLPTILLKRLWGFFFFNPPFSQSTAMLEKEISLRLCASI